jgi:hypothetical protein
MASSIARESCILGRPRPLGARRNGPRQSHSLSDKSVGYLLFSMVSSVCHCHTTKEFPDSFSRHFGEQNLQGGLTALPAGITVQMDFDAVGAGADEGTTH